MHHVSGHVVHQVSGHVVHHVSDTTWSRSQYKSCAPPDNLLRMLSLARVPPPLSPIP